MNKKKVKLLLIFLLSIFLVTLSFKVVSAACPGTYPTENDNCIGLHQSSCSNNPCCDWDPFMELCDEEVCANIDEGLCGYCGCGCTPGECDMSSRQYCRDDRTWTDTDAQEYCDNCGTEVCGDGTCNCGETSSTCPSDNCDGGGDDGTGDTTNLAVCGAVPASGRRVQDKFYCCDTTGITLDYEDQIEEDPTTSSGSAYCDEGYVVCGFTGHPERNIFLDKIQCCRVIEDITLTSCRESYNSYDATYCDSNEVVRGVQNSANRRDGEYVIKRLYCCDISRTDGTPITVDLNTAGEAIDTVEAETKTCLDDAGTGPEPDTTPPEIYIENPNQGEVLGIETTQVTLEISTDEPADCKYHTEDFSFDDGNIPFFDDTGGETHRQLINVASGTNHTYYYICQDPSENPSEPVRHTFYVRGYSQQGEKCNFYLDCFPGRIDNNLSQDVLGGYTSVITAGEGDIEGYYLTCVDNNHHGNSLSGTCQATCAGVICPYEPRDPSNPDSVFLAYTIGCFKPYIEARCINIKGIKGSETDVAESCADPPRTYMWAGEGFTMCKKGYNIDGSDHWFWPHGMDWTESTGVPKTCTWTHWPKEYSQEPYCKPDSGYSCMCDQPPHIVTRRYCKCFSHFECINNICAEVQGPGINECPPEARGQPCTPQSCGTAKECEVSCTENINCLPEEECSIPTKAFWYGDVERTYSFNHTTEETLTCFIDVKTACFGGQEDQPNENLRILINSEEIGLTEDPFCPPPSGICYEDGPHTTSFIVELDIRTENTLTIQYIGDSIGLRSLLLKCRGEERFNWDKSAEGYCDTNSQCLVNPESLNQNMEEMAEIDFVEALGNDIDCIDNGTFIGDHYCENGAWTTRTKLIALQLLQSTENYDQNDYVLFCDSFENTLNQYNYEIVTIYGANQAGDYLDENCEILNTPIPCTNKVCVLKYKNPEEDNYRVAIGTSLNNEINQPESYSILELFKRDLHYCDGVEDDGTFHHCDDTYYDAWFNKNLNSIIFSKDIITLSELDFWQKFLIFLRNPFNNIFDIILTTIRPSYPGGGEFIYEFIENTTDFDRIYLQKKDTKSIKAITEEIKEPTKSNKFLSITYEGFENTDICESIDAYNKKLPPPRYINCDLDNEIYYVETLSEIDGEIDVWPYLTSKLRIQ